MQLNNNIIKNKYNNKNNINNKDDNNHKLEEILREEIYANDKIKDILISKDKKKILFLYKDYILYFVFLRMKIKVKKKEIKELIFELIDKIIQLYSIDFISDEANISSLNIIDQIINKINNEKEFITKISKIILFLEDNIEYIYKIILIFIDFIDIIPNFIEKFIKIANNKRNFPILYKIFDSFIDTINNESKFNYYISNNEIKYNKIELLKKNLIYMKFISDKINSISIQNTEIFIDCINNKSNKLLNLILDIQNKSFNNNNIISNINLEIIKENNKNFEDSDYTTLINILIKLYQIDDKIEDKKEIIEYFLTDNKFIKDSFYLTFFYSTLKINEKNCFEDNKNVLNLDVSIEEKYNEIIGTNNNKYLMENLIYYFEIFHENTYFKNIKKKNIKNDYYSEILGKDSLKRVNYAYEYYENEFKNNSKNLKLLYMIGYIKIYFKYYAKIIYNCQNRNEIFNFKSIEDTLKLNQNKSEPMKLLKIYIFELIYEQCNKENKILIEFIDNYNIDYLKSSIEKISEYIEYKKKTKTNYFMFLYEVPNIKLFKERIDPNKNILLNNLFQNEDKITMLNKLPSINKVTNIILESLNYKKTKEQLKNKLKDEAEIMKIDGFTALMENYILNYNSLIDDDSQRLINDYKDYPLDKFIIEKNNENNLLYSIYKNFINNQNNFIDGLINNKNSKGINEFLQKIETIYVQDAQESDILKRLEENKILEFIIQNSFIKYNFDNSNKDILFDVTYKNINFDFDKIEKLIMFEVLVSLKKFYPEEYGIKKLKLKGEKYKEIDNDIINDYQQKFGNKTLEDNEKNKINDFLKDLSKKDNYELLLSLQYLMYHILSESNNLSKDKDITEVIKSISQENTWIQFDLLKQLFRKEERQVKEDDDYFDYIEAFNNNYRENNCKLNQLIKIFDICKNVYELKN